MKTHSYSIHIAPLTWGTDEPWWDIEIPASLRPEKGIEVDGKVVKLGSSRYEVIVNDTHLGVVGKDDEGWYFGLSNSAYYAPGTELMDRLDAHRDHRADSMKLEIGGHRGYRTRESAVHDMLYELLKRGAASIAGFVHEARAEWVTKYEGRKEAVVKARQVVAQHPLLANLSRDEKLALWESFERSIERNKLTLVEPKVEEAQVNV